jgi:hypothetical protein
LRLNASGIGQSRLCILFLQEIHVGEVQCSVWPQHMPDELRLKNVILLSHTILADVNPSNPLPKLAYARMSLRDMDALKGIPT